MKSWHDLIAVEDLEKSDVTFVAHGTLTLAVYDCDDGVYVSDSRCTHAGANLCDGFFNGSNIECPLHQGLFDARTGRAKAAPATRALKMYPARIDNGMVQIDFSK